MTVPMSSSVVVPGIRVASDAETTDAVCVAAAAAAREWRGAPAAARAAVLEHIADRLDAAGDDLVPIARAETSLAEGRLRGELRRTTFQLRFFADLLRSGTAIEATVDAPDPDWPMGAARPDLRRTRVGIGPVLVFAASNFPFAFSVAGGDTASALAAGCPVIVKAHSGHPELSIATARVVATAAAEAGAPDGLVALVTGTENGRRALLHPAVAAAGFTGSIPGGRTLFDLANSRPHPIPFHGELGSVNPVVVTARAADARGDEIASGWLASLLGSAGQLCTKPGIIAVPRGSSLDTAIGGSELPAVHGLLNERIASGFRSDVAAVRARSGVEVLAEEPGSGAVVFGVEVETFLADHDVLGSELFGPAGLVVAYNSEDDVTSFLESFEGQLTTTIFAEGGEAEEPLARRLVDRAVERSGRVLWNEWPTGVSVTYAQQHGGPYPASTSPTGTSVGAAAMERFLRPVAYQGFPASLLPDALLEP